MAYQREKIETKMARNKTYITILATTYKLRNGKNNSISDYR